MGNVGLVFYVGSKLFFMGMRDRHTHTWGQRHTYCIAEYRSHCNVMVAQYFINLIKLLKFDKNGNDYFTIEACAPGVMQKWLLNQRRL